MSARNFASHFARKAFNDLGEYDFVKAKHADHLQDLLNRPYEDILADRSSTLCLRALSWRKLRSKISPLLLLRRPQIPSRRSRRRMRPWSWMRVPRLRSLGSPLMRMPLWKALLWEVSSGQPGSSSRPPKVEGSPMGEGATRRPKPNTRQAKVEGSSLEEESTPPPPMEPATTEEAEKRFAKEFGAIQQPRCCPMLLSWGGFYSGTIGSSANE